MALLEKAFPSPKVLRCLLSSEKGVRLVRAREKGAELREDTTVGTRRDTKVLNSNIIVDDPSLSNGAEEQCCGRACAHAIAKGDTTQIKCSEVGINFSPQHDPMHLLNTTHHANGRWQLPSSRWCPTALIAIPQFPK